MAKEIKEITYDLPKNKEEYYAKGKMIFIDDSFIVFEVPAVFKEDDTLDIDLTEDKIGKAIDYMKNDFEKKLRQ